MSGMKIEAIFAGVLALVVLAVAIFAVVKTQFGGETTPPVSTITPAARPASTPVKAISGTENSENVICQCFDGAFKLAGKVEVISPEYRTGFEQCRAVAGVKGGDAWTAGWNARLSAKPFEASCKAYLRRST